jgi:hypothetical protein
MAVSRWAVRLPAHRDEELDGPSARFTFASQSLVIAGGTQVPSSISGLGQ